jgi:hypothetical protein
MRENSKMNLILELIHTQLFQCHCEERSDAAISTFFYEIASFHSRRLPRSFRARSDIVKIYIAFILG